MSQPDNYTPQEVTGTTATLDVVLVWAFDGISELTISQTDGTTTVSEGFDAFVSGQTVTVENYFGDGNTTTITVGRDTKQTQEFTQSESNPLDADALNAALDKTVRMIQDVSYTTNQIAEDIGGGDIADLLDKAITSEEPYIEADKAGRANKFKAYDQDGNPIYVVPNNVEPPDGPVNPEDYLTIINDIKQVTGTTYTFLDTDTGKQLQFTNAGNITVTSPDDLPQGWQAQIVKLSSGNSITHVVDGGATHINDIAVTANGNNAQYYASVLSNTGNDAVYKFAGEIDSTSEGLNEELASKTVEITGSSIEAGQAVVETVGKYLHENVKITFNINSALLTGAKALEFNGFNGPGTFIVNPLNAWNEDHTARPTQITNTNNPDAADYTQFGFDQLYENWEVIKSNAAISLTGNTCGKVQIQGISFSAKAFPIVLDSNSSYVQILACHANQINSFTNAELGTACCLSLATNVGFITTLCTNDQDGNGIYAQAGTVTLDNTSGSGSHLVRVERGSVASELNDTSNSGFTSSVQKVDNAGGLFVSNGEVQ